MKDFRNKTAVVTGGASGMGRCLALDLAREGCRVALVDVNDEGLRSVADEVAGLGGQVSTHLVDVSDFTQVQALAEEVSPNLLVNCAGIGIMAELENTTLEDWRRIIDVNLFGQINMVKAFLPHLKAGVDSHIVTIASLGGIVSNPILGAYCTSKFAVVGYSEALYVELAKYGIKVTTVNPGPTWTPILVTSEVKGFERDKFDRALDFLKPLIFTTPDALSKEIIKAVKKNKPLLFHTWIGKSMYMMKRLSPRLFLLGSALVYRAVNRATK